MADITKYLESIMSAIYGEEVRKSIHDAIYQINNESVSAKEIAITSKESATSSALIAKEAENNAKEAEYRAISILGTFEEDTPERHRKTFRGKNLGDAVTENQLAKIRNGTFDDLYLGDYWLINENKWRIVDFDYWYGIGPYYYNGLKRCENHHVVIMPDNIVSGSLMHTNDTVSGGYANSILRTQNLAPGGRTYNVINAAFGSILLNHPESLINVTTEGCPKACGWFASSVEIPNEIMMYGTTIRAYTGVESVNCISSRVQLSLFSVAPRFINVGSDYWLRDTVKSGYYSIVSQSGDTNIGHMTSQYFVRPVFAIG